MPEPEVAKRAAERIAVFGAGLVGSRHARIAARWGNLVGIADPAPRALELAQSFGVPWFATPEECLDTERPDGVIIATPNQLHVDHARACIARGIPILIEKPVSDRSEMAMPMLEEADAAGVPVLVGHHRRHNPIVQAAKAVIDEGALGQIVTTTGQFWLYKPEGYFSEHWRRETGAGPVFINLIHDIDLLRHFCGEVTSVQAVESSATRGFEVEDTAAIILEFSSGALGSFTLSDTAVAPWSWEFTAGENPAYPHVPGHCYMIGGTRAALSVPDLKLWHHPGARGWWEPMGHRQIDAGTGDSLERQFSHFLEVIRAKVAPLVSGLDALQSLRVIEAIKAAAASGKRERL